MEANIMNEDILAAQWKEMRGELKSWWGKLTDDDFEWIGGQKDKLLGLIQERYGYTRDQARDEMERRFDEYSNKASEITKSAAKRLETAASYLRENRLADIAADFAGLVRKYPVQSLLFGLDLGYLLTRGKSK
jgi:uncharacterized protein YjbJ (UPF0337 family)